MFRAPMRARSLELDRFEGARDGIERGLVGIGEPLRELPETLEQAVEATAREHNEKSGRMLRRFAELPSGTLVWTQTASTTFRLGKITGPWRYDCSRAARRTGIRNVRPAAWVETVFDEHTAPAAVVFTFGRGGRNLQAVSDPDAVKFSNRLWRQAATVA